ncbi:MAG: NUDIX hydrolase [Nanoarchaeota archaeon]|nr:NUDIX hydrolase [Nanoarchaeota archaeon]
MVTASSAIILKDKKILLVKRSNYTEIFPQCWACPGGLAEGNESAEKTVSREVKEEINFNFKPTRLFSTGKYQERVLYRFLGDWHGQVKIQKGELSDWNWFSYEEAIKLTLAFDYREIIEKLHKEKLI